MVKQGLAEFDPVRAMEWTGLGIECSNLRIAALEMIW